MKNQRVNFGKVSEKIINESHIRDSKSFGKLVIDNEQIKEIRESFRAAITDQAERFKQLIESLDGSTEDDKESLRESLKSLRTEWLEGLKSTARSFVFVSRILEMNLRMIEKIF